MNLPKFEYIYLFWSPQYARCAKIGFSDHWRRRMGEVRTQISDTTGRQIGIYGLALPVLYAYKSEQMFHRALKRLKRCDMPDHAGRSEWFWFVNVITACLLYLLMRWMGRDDASGWFIAALLIPVPVDFALCIIVFAVVQYGVVVWLLWTAFSFVI